MHVSDEVDIWMVPVSDMLALWDPYSAWPDIILDPSEVQAAIASNAGDQRPFNTLAAHDIPNLKVARAYHAKRVAWLFSNLDTTPIEIDVGAPSLGYHPNREPFDFIDGNHRLCAADMRKDRLIAVTYSGECALFPAIFPNATILSK